MPLFFPCDFSIFSLQVMMLRTADSASYHFHGFPPTAMISPSHSKKEWETYEESEGNTETEPRFEDDSQVHKAWTIWLLFFSSLLFLLFLYYILTPIAACIHAFFGLPNSPEVNNRFYQPRVSRKRGETQTYTIPCFENLRFYARHSSNIKYIVPGNEIKEIDFQLNEMNLKF